MATIVSLLLGIATWTLTEYLLHRFLGHVHKGKNFFKSEHALHHSKANYFAPAYKKALAAVLVSAGLFFVLALIVPYAIAATFIMGFVGMYGAYEATHYRYHSATPLKVFLFMRKHHFYHHFHNPKTNHGVTTRFWDRVFGTFHPVDKVRVPRSMSMQWLVANDTIKTPYTAHFQLSGR